MYHVSIIESRVAFLAFSHLFHPPMYFRCFNHYLFVKNADDAILSQFLFDHTVVDSEDDLYDLYVLTQMDIHIQGSSTYTTLAVTIRPNKIIISDQPGDDKYNSRYHPDMNRVYHQQNLTYVDAVSNLPPKCLNQ